MTQNEALKALDNLGPNQVLVVRSETVGSFYISSFDEWFDGISLIKSLGGQPTFEIVEIGDENEHQR